MVRPSSPRPAVTRRTTNLSISTSPPSSPVTPVPVPGGYGSQSSASMHQRSASQSTTASSSSRISIQQPLAELSPLTGVFTDNPFGSHSPPLILRQLPGKSSATVQLTSGDSMLFDDPVKAPTTPPPRPTRPSM